MQETGLVFDREGRTIGWHEPEGRTGGSLPDTDEHWEMLWENRHRLGGVAHVHPWDGPARPSSIDLHTYSAIERGLGRRFLWPVVTFTEVMYVAWDETSQQYSSVAPHITIADIEELRRRSR